MATPTVAVLGLVLLGGALAGPFQRPTNAELYDEVRQLLSLTQGYQQVSHSPGTRPETELRFRATSGVGNTQYVRVFLAPYLRLFIGAIVQ